MARTPSRARIKAGNSRRRKARIEDRIEMTTQQAKDLAFWSDIATQVFGYLMARHLEPEPAQLFEPVNEYIN